MYQQSLFLPDGTEVRLVPLEYTAHRPLYCSADGRVFSFCRRYLYPLKPTISNYPCSKVNGRRKQVYFKLRQDYGCILIHIAVALAWVERLETLTAMRLEVDHLNGVTTDNRACNLGWVTPAENRKRAVILRARRMIARQDNDPSKDPRNMKPEELLALFNAYNVAGDCYEGE